MNATSLKRKTINKSDLDKVLDKQDNDLAKKCAVELGYTCLAKEHNKEREQQRVLRVLDELGLPPFDEKTVEAYQRMRVWDAERLRFTWPNPRSPATYFAGVFYLLATAVFYALVAVPQASNPSGWYVLTAFTVIAVLLTLMATAVDGKRASWRILPLSSYMQPIPSYVAQTALDLRARLFHNSGNYLYDRNLAKEKITVEELIIEDRPADPFLVLTDACGTRYYVEVWDEQNFNESRRV